MCYKDIVCKQKPSDKGCTYRNKIIYDLKSYHYEDIGQSEKAFSLKKKQMKQVGGGSYCTDLITNYNNNHTKWSKEVQEIALDMMQAHC